MIFRVAERCELRRSLLTAASTPTIRHHNLDPRWIGNLPELAQVKLCISLGIRLADSWHDLLARVACSCRSK